MDGIAQESSHGWNNAGTGHAAFCEMNYTAQDDEGNIDLARRHQRHRAVRDFPASSGPTRLSRGVLNDPPALIANVPHMSVVWGQENIEFSD